MATGKNIRTYFNGSWHEGDIAVMKAADHGMWLGSNVFDLLIAVPAGVLIAGSITVNFTQTVPLMGFLMIATVVVLAFMLRDMKISVREAWTMTLMYLGFGTWMALEAFGVTSVLGLSVVG